MTDDPRFKSCVDFLNSRLLSDAVASPALRQAVRRIVDLAVAYYDAGYTPDYAGGYSDACEDTVKVLSAIWSSHPDYQGWADDLN